MNKTEKGNKLFSSGGIFVDLFIGFLIAACLAGIVYRCFVYDPSARTQEGTSYMVYFEVENPHESFAEYLERGDAVYDDATGLCIGKLATHDQHAENSIMAIIENQEIADAPLVMRGVFRSVSGEVDQGTLTIGGSYTLTPGQVLEIYTDTVSVQVRILQITENTEEK